MVWCKRYLKDLTPQYYAWHLTKLIRRVHESSSCSTSPALDRPFWKPVRRKEAVFFFLVLIHVLAIIGIILFPLPSLKVLGWPRFLLLLAAWERRFVTTACWRTKR